MKILFKNRIAKAAVAALGLALIPVGAFAAETSDSFALPETQLSIVDQTFYLKKFDSSLGTLTGITFIINTTVKTNPTVTNTDIQTVTYNLTSGAALILSDPTNTLQYVESLPTTTLTGKTLTVAQHSKQYNFSVNGSATNVYDVSGATATLNTGLSDSDGITADTFDVLSFIGNSTDTFAVRLDGTIYGGASGLGSISYADSGTASATVEVIYTYDAFPVEPIPEPSTWAMVLGGIGFLAMAQRVRHRSR